MTTRINGRMDFADMIKTVLSRKQRMRKRDNLTRQPSSRPELADLASGKEDLEDQSVEKSSTEGRKLWVAADRLRDIGDWPGAANLYKSAIEAGCEISAMYVQYGHALKESGDINLAEAAYRRAVRLDPRSADAQLQLGHALKIQGRTNEAELAYLQGHFIDPLEESGLAELTAIGWTPSTIAMVTQSRSSATTELALHVAFVRLSAALETFAQTTAEKLDVVSAMLREMSWSIADQRATLATKGGASNMSSIVTELYAIRSNMWLLRARKQDQSGELEPQ